jgi:hypothetical protein
LRIANPSLVVVLALMGDLGLVQRAHGAGPAPQIEAAYAAIEAPITPASSVASAARWTR